MTSASMVLIGAGSTVFTPGLMRDLVASPVFQDWTVYLVDLNGEAAEVMAELGRRLAGERGSEVNFVPHVDRREALPGATFVTTTVAVGAADGWRQDLEIPSRYGITQTVGDTVGPGGVLRALRHVPELVAIATDVADLAPDAQLINYSNPLTANVRAVNSETNVRAVGLCHGTRHTLAKLAADLGVSAERRSALHATFAGLNHLCWLLELRLGAEDLYPALDREVSARSRGIDASGTREESVHLPVSADLYRLFGRYPAPGDRHVAEFFPWYLRSADGTPLDESRLPWGLQGGRDDTISYIDGKAQLWDDLRAQADGTRPLPDWDAGSENQEGERLVAIAEAMITGRRHTELAVNLPNSGAIANLPPEVVVEVPALVGSAGIRGVRVGPLPRAIAAVLIARAEQQELTVRAALSGERATALQALALDPLVPNPDIARGILDDAITAHGGAMQRFAAPPVSR